MTSTSRGEKILSLLNIGIDNSSKCPSTSFQVPVYQINNDIDHEEIILQHDSSEQVNELQDYESRTFTELRPVVDTCTTKAIADNIECEQQNPIASTEVEDGISYYGCTYDVNELQDYESRTFTELRPVVDTCTTKSIADNIECEQQNPIASTEVEDGISYYGCTYDVNDLQENESQMFTELKEYDVTDTSITTEIADNMEYEQQNSIPTAEIEDNIELEYEQQQEAISTTEIEDIMIDECMYDDDLDADKTYIPPFDSDNSDSNSDSDSKSSLNSSSPIEKLQKSNKGDGLSTLNRSESILELIDAPITDDATKKDLQDIDCMKSRKRKRNTRRWKSNEAKAKRNLGKEYISVKGKTVDCRNVKPPCNEQKCRLKCSTKVTEDKRKEIFDCYWELGDINRQREFIVRHVTTIKPKYRYVREGSNRSSDHAFHLRTDNGLARVCKTFFMSTLDITNKTIRTAISKHLSSGVVEGDKRGTHKNHPTTPDVVTQRVKDHINRFYRIPSHYLRAQTNREYLEGNLSIAEMHRMFNKESQITGVQPVSYPLYAHVFNNNFNLGFFKPKKDLCVKCESFKNASEDEKVAMESRHTEHLKNKNLAREHKLRDTSKAKEGNSIVCACFDLQAVLQTPSGDASLFYYKRKLSTFNFTIYDTGARQGHCFVWHEAIAKRGSNEIGSCLLMFLERQCKGKDVIFYSDNCVGQNKNKYLASLYLYAVQKMGVKSITHKYLEVGHTQNEGDMMHSLIENQKKRQLKRGTIYVPSQWITVLQNSKKTGKPFEITELTTGDVVDLKKLSERVGNNYLKNTEGEKVPWCHLRIIRVVKEEPFTLHYKTTFFEYESSNFSKISVRARTRGKANDLVLDKAYSAPPPISAAKKKDLLDLCKANLITTPYHAFYEGLNSSNNTPDFFPNDTL